MQLHFIVGKNRHADITDAILAEEAIRAADVVSFEAPLLSLERVIEAENQIREASTVRGARRKKAIADMRAKQTYDDWIQAILSENNKPVVFIERYGDEELGEIRAKRAREKYVQRLIATRMLEGDADAALHQGYALLLVFKDLARYRDARIGRIGRTISQRIEELYPHLAEKQQVNYLILLGAYHRAEFELMRVPHAMVSIKDWEPKTAYTTWMQKAGRRVIYDGAGLEEVREDIVRATLTICAELVVPQHPLREAVLTKLVEGMREADLRQLLSSFSGAEENGIEQMIVDSFRRKGITLPSTAIACQRMYRELYRTTEQQAKKSE